MPDPRAHGGDLAQRQDQAADQTITDCLRSLTATTPLGLIHLDVPYEQKDEAKRLLTARWDREARRWWVDADRITREQAARWLP
ncbi:DUF5710 domain-containing protein [Streptomyces iconiensis]|uniref:DUF5710 domain-containing protein n=1 Tax=Streptomyces iconiensis TaxID=1384038 RepID=A0ABT6ZPM5_9ACTN|nr:DUF5710 domain-containing protein [Streptomyces iconiensis]MDJ1130812.1 DUF5710 domain-containing protein [Streptomyces iconiensis]